MRKLPLYFKTSFLLISSYCQILHGQNIRVISPYIGSITDNYKNEQRNLDLKDNSLLKGFFVQWINIKNYQWNIFIYQSSNINFSTLWGGHFIFDYYFYSSPKGKFVFGTGAEYLKIDMNANSNITPFNDFELLNKIYIPYIRLGYAFPFLETDSKISFMPWVGIQCQMVRGNLTMTADPPGPAPSFTVKEVINSTDYFAISGLNINARFYYVVELDIKYYGTFDRKNYYSTISGLINLYLAKHLGLSYRVKYMELSKGYDLYNLFGIALVF